MDALLTDAHCAELQTRGQNYLRVLGLDEDMVEDCLSRAFVNLCGSIDNLGSDERRDFADKTWRAIILQAIADEFRNRKKLYSQTRGNFMCEDSSRETEEKDFFDKVLSKAFPFLSDDDIIVLLALVDCDFNFPASAEYLGIKRTTVYATLYRIRSRLVRIFPEILRSYPPLMPQTYVAKTWNWSRFLAAVEEVDFIEVHPALFEPAYELDLTKNRGLVPTSTPSIVQMELSKWGY